MVLHPRLTNKYPEGSINATTKNLSIQTVQQPIKESQGGDALTRMQQLSRPREEL